MMKGVIPYIICVSFLLSSSSVVSQDDFLYTKKFSRLLERHNLEFYLPVERWMKLSPLQEDEYLRYDAVFHSPPNVEVRLIIDKDTDLLFPNVEIVKLISHITTNEEDTFIEITEYPSKMSKERYGADFVLYADFQPKQTLTSLPYGRLLCLYREGGSLVKYIILYDGQLDPFFKLPIRFSEDGSLDPED